MASLHSAALATLGDLIADLCLDIQDLPIQVGRHQTVSDLELGPGGAGNALVAATRLGLSAVALGAVGDDWVGDRVLALLDSEGVDTSAVQRLTSATTRTAVRLRSAAGEQVFMGKPGSQTLSTWPTRWMGALATAGTLLVDGWSYFHDEAQVIAEGVEQASAMGLTVLFDPGPRVGAIDLGWLRSVVAATAVVLVTEPEYQGLTARLDLTDNEAFPSLQAVFVKAGAAGCTIVTRQKSLVCPGYPVNAVDATAAGDCFAAAVAWGVMTNRPWDVIGAVANAVGAAKCRKIGTALAAPTRAEVLDVLKTHRPELVGLLTDA